MPEVPISLRVKPQIYEQLWSLAGITHHSGPGAMARRLLNIALLESQVEIPIPAQPDPRSGPFHQVFLALNKSEGDAVKTGASTYNIAPSRFSLYVVEHGLTCATEAIPQVDELSALRANFINTLTQNGAKYLPLG